MELMRQMGWEIDEALEKTNPRDRSAHYTYIIASYGGVVKIGHSATPKRRLSALQIGSPFALRIDKTWKLAKERAKLLERQMHAAFSWAYERGEWFRVSVAGASAVGDLFAAGRLHDALHLAGLIRRIAEAEKHVEHLRDAWYMAGGSRTARRDAEYAARAAMPAAEADVARLWLEAFELGYTGGRGERQQDLKRRRAIYEAKVAAVDPRPTLPAPPETR